MCCGWPAGNSAIVLQRLDTCENCSLPCLFYIPHSASNAACEKYMEMWSPHAFTWCTHALIGPEHIWNRVEHGPMLASIGLSCRLRQIFAWTWPAGRLHWRPFVLVIGSGSRRSMAARSGASSICQNLQHLASSLLKPRHNAFLSRHPSNSFRSNTFGLLVLLLQHIVNMHIQNKNIAGLIRNSRYSNVSRWFCLHLGCCWVILNRAGKVQAPL